MNRLVWQLRLLAAAGFVLLATPFLAGLGGAGAIAVPALGLVFAIRYTLTNDPAQWASPAVPLLALLVNTVVAGLLWAAGRWIGGALAWSADWGLAPPLMLAGIATAVSVKLWPAKKDAAVNRMMATLPDEDGAP